MVLLEAMACALPCVTTDAGNCAEMIAVGAPEPCGRITPIGDSSALAAAALATATVPSSLTPSPRSPSDRRRKAPSGGEGGRGPAGLRP